MNYLSLSLQQGACEIQVYSLTDQLLETERYQFLSQVKLARIAELAEKLKHVTWQYVGIVVPKEWGQSEEKITLADGTTVSLTYYLTETFNRPITTTKELSKVDDKAVFFANAADRFSWTLEYEGYLPGKQEYAVESLLTVGNGFIGLRGTIPEMEISSAHYPATYLAGLYNAVESVVEGEKVWNEEFVNSPNLQYFSLMIDGELLALSSDSLLSLSRHLDLKSGLFTSEAVLTTPLGKKIRVDFSRVVSMADRHGYAIKYELTPLNFSGAVTVVTKSDADVYNYNVERYRSLTREHLTVVHLEAKGEQTTTVVKTNNSAIQVVQHSQLFGASLKPGTIVNHLGAKVIQQDIPLEVVENQTYVFEKSVRVATFNSHEEVAATAFKQQLEPIADFETVYQASAKAWQEMWREVDLVVTGDLMSQKLLRLHTYHLLTSGAPISNLEQDVSITARGLHGEAYRGHIFWDELFILPFYISHYPEMAKELLMYRYRRLGQGKLNAKEAGYSGAMFPWQSGLDGREQTQEVHLNPLTGEWGEDYSRLQRHVSLAIAYNVWLYWNNTGDEQFMLEFGNELLLEIAEFWRSKTIWDDRTKRYSIEKVMGPDEFHEAYPTSEQGGLKNNAYTNLMVTWLFEQIGILSSGLSQEEQQKLLRKTNLRPEALAEMAEIGQKLSLEVNEAGVMAQFEGYFALKELDWAYYQKKYGNVYRMDRILKAEGKSADDYQVAKQADTLMIFYNFSKSKVDHLLERLAYTLPADYLATNLNYYLARTSHGSTLSRIVHAHLAEIVGQRQLSWDLYQAALGSDYRDIQGGTTAEGIHTGVMAATLQVTLSAYAGVEFREAELTLSPDLPTSWQGLAFKLKRRQVDYQIALTHETVSVTASATVMLQICGKMHQLTKGENLTVKY